MKTIRYALEALLLYILFGIFRLLPVDKASGFGGWLGRHIGPRLAASRKAGRNLRRALPDLDEASVNQAVTAMWDNLGRVVAEYPHLETIATSRVEVEGLDRLEEALAGDNGVLFFSAHFGNWEVCGPYLALVHKITANVTYRAPNNPWADRLLMRARTLKGRVSALPKERRSGKRLMQALKNGEYIGILIDQKYNEGVAVPFFGEPAMTNPVFVQLPQKYGCPLMPVHCERLDNARFRLIFDHPVALSSADGAPRPVEDVISDAHKHLEAWIRKNPGQWLWLHRRWDSKRLQEQEHG